MKSDAPYSAKDRAGAWANRSSIPSPMSKVHCTPNRKLRHNELCNERRETQCSLQVQGPAPLFVEGPCNYSPGIKLPYICSWKEVYQRFYNEQNAKECFCEMQRPEFYQGRLDLAHLYQGQKEHVLLAAMWDFSYPPMSNYRDASSRRVQKHMLRRGLTG